jgi:hypothetical protein
MKRLIEAGPVTDGEPIPYNDKTGKIVGLVHGQDVKSVVVLFGCKIWIDIISLSFDFLEPAPKHEVLLKGNLGYLDGQEMWTDAYLHPDEQWVGENIYLLFKDGRIVKHPMVNAN